MKVARGEGVAMFVEWLDAELERLIAEANEYGDGSEGVEGEVTGYRVVQMLIRREW